MRTNKKGFTLAELLIVVAIIAVLVAIAIPIFSSQLTKAKQAADNANVRAAYAEAVSKCLSDGGNQSASAGTMQADYDGNTKIGSLNNISWSANQTVNVTASTGSDGNITVSVG